MDIKRLRIAFVSSYDARDKKVFSGTSFYVSASLVRQCGKVDFIGPYPNTLLLTFFKGFSYLVRKITGKRFDHYTVRLLAKKYGAFFTNKLHGKKFDLI